MSVEFPIEKALLVSKKTFKTEILEGNDAHLKELLSKQHSSMLGTIRSHEEHVETLNVVEQALTAVGLEFLSVMRHELADNACGHFDLVITVGGDGTLLDVSHSITCDVPVLTVNSSPSTSFGHYALARQDNFSTILNEILSGQRQPLTLNRLELILDNKVLPTLVLNEVLVAHSCPAGTSRYCLTVGDRTERQLSSGLLVGPATGSTGFLRSAGGTVLPVTAPQYQFLVREPFLKPGEPLTLLQGIVESDAELKVVSLMLDGKLYIDGQHIAYDFLRSRELRVRCSDTPLLAYIDSAANDRYIPPKA